MNYQAVIESDESLEFQLAHTSKVTFVSIEILSRRFGAYVLNSWEGHRIL